jgi:hypothetical protein
MTTTLVRSNTKLRLLDNVLLREDVPDYALKKGAIGTIVEIFEPDAYEVEFIDNKGQTYGMCSLLDRQLMYVPSSVLKFLELLEDEEPHLNLEELKSSAYPRNLKPLFILVEEGTLKSLEQVADSREITIDALVRLYIGQCLRKDLSDLFKNTVLERTEEVLNQHLDSADQISDIMQEIRSSYQSRDKTL